MEWDRGRCLALIDLYKSYPELWNQSHSSYYNKPKKQKIWNCIAEQLNCSSVNEIRRKMESILASYRRVKLRCIRTNTNGVEQLQPSKWYAFDRLSFLRDKDNSNYITPKKKLKSEVQDDESAHSQTDDPLNHSSEDEFNEEDFQLDEEYSFPPENPKVTIEEYSQTSKVQEPLPMAQSQFTISEDEFDLFGKYLANKLKRYDKTTSAVVQHEISKIIFKADMGELINFKGRNNIYNLTSEEAYITSTPTGLDKSVGKQ